MADHSEFHTRVNPNCINAVKGLKAVQRDLRKATQILAEFENSESPTKSQLDEALAIMVRSHELLGKSAAEIKLSAALMKLK